jgi:ferrochelatase
MSTAPVPSTLDQSSVANVAGYDALLLVGFGGPEGPDDVMPFLENVVRGRPVPRERLLEVAEHYQHFGGKSPINDQVRELIVALRAELDRQGVGLPVYWGNRNWHPMLTDTVAAMKAAGVQKALAIVLAAYSSYSSCRQYRENVYAAADASGEGAPVFDKMRVYYNHPDFVAANADRLREALDRLPADLRDRAHVAFTAHSIPSSMAAGCDYARQLQETCRLVAEEAGVAPDRWALVYQSRSGRPEDPWLEPDILDHVRAVHAAGAPALVVAPVGFLSDHMEVMYDLDEEARHLCDELGLPMERAGTVGTHPRFVAMMAELIVERMAGSPDRRAVGHYPANHDVCPVNCCPAPARPGRPAAGAGDPGSRPM